MAGIDATMIGGDFLFSVEADNTVVDALRENGITLGGLYADFKLARPSVDTAVKKALGGERDDQELRAITSGSLVLRIPLHCFTNERFLEVLGYYESREIKKRLEEEFSQNGIKVEGLKVEIENLAEVNETKEAINNSYRIVESLSGGEGGNALNARVSLRPGGGYSFGIVTDKVEVVDLLSTAGVTVAALYAPDKSTGITLGTLFLVYKLSKPITDAVVKALGGSRDDQKVQTIKSGSLHVRLDCFTDERFLEVLGYYESGEIKKRLEEEFSQIGIKVEGLKVKIENFAEVDTTKEAIIKRKVENKDNHDVESDVEETANTSMAARGEDVSSYDVDRFVGQVKEDLLCSFCKCVPKDPRLCENNDHIFCFPEISRHLENSQTCPYCREPLTLETLRRPKGFLKNYIDDLKIKCDHHDRGCLDKLSLEGLQRHVDQCGYAPVMCGNEGCGMVVNKRDKENHEKNFCQFRIAKCHDCKDIKASQDEMKNEMKEELSEIKNKMTGIERKQEETKRTQDKMNMELTEMKNKMTGIETKQKERKRTQDKMNMELSEMKYRMTGIERKQDRMQESVDEMKRKFDTMMIMVHQALQGSKVNNVNNGSQATDPRVSSNNQDIVILGGFYGAENDKLSNTVEKFNIVEGKSTWLPRMNKPRARSASCVCNGDVIVSGGFDGQDGTDSIEILKMNQQPLRWTMFGGKLPVKLSSHAAIVYQHKLYVAGGYNWDEKKTSDVIYEVDLASPYAAKILIRMPQARSYHGAEIVNGELFILGGTTTGYSNDVLDSVVVYDFIRNEFNTCPPIPKPVGYMSTVTWGNMIIIVGGRDKNGQDLNDVIMYDTETGRSERLPSMKHKRSGPSVVIVDDVILALGGWNEEQKHLNSIESFTMGSDGWKELPAMIEKRYRASAVVVPRI